MDYSEAYRQKLTTADEAVKVIKSGDWVDYGWCIATVDALDRALARRADELSNVNLRGGVLQRPVAIASVPNAQKHFTWNSWHTSPLERKMVSAGMAYYTPIRYSELPSFYQEGLLTTDVAMFQVAPMDADGWFNFGPNASHMEAMCKTAKVIIVEVNQNMPYCMGAGHNGIHIQDVDMIVEGDHPTLYTNASSDLPSEIDIAVAKLVVEEIPNGACLQLGIGSMPSAIGQLIAESDLKDLGVHSEAYVDAFMTMTKAGKITGAHKNFDKGRQTYTFASGSKELFEFLHHNPECMNAPVDYCNDITRLSQLDNFISINGAVDIDLFGQVSAESSGIRHISGSGGQQDFVIGAYLSKGGKSFICCSSTVTDKKTGEMKSRIRPTLLEGTVATCTRSNLHYLVTEYGKVNVKGLATWQRAEALISIAHPHFREELIREAEAMGIWRRSNRR